MGRVILSSEAKKYERIVCDLAKLHTLLVRYVERNTNLRVITMRDFERVLQGPKLTCTYKFAIENLKEHIQKLCKNEHMINLTLKLEQEINESDIKDMRFGINPQRRFTDIEDELDSLLTRRQLFMGNELMSISTVSEKLNISESTIKQACQTERLLNTRKIGKTWLVHLPECEAYWKKQGHTEKNLYYNVEY